MNTKLKKQTGFTIIEVLIVLAIAGLIMLIVFLAVPALQRNNRNTQRRNDVGALLAGINDFATNSNGRLPDDFTNTDGTVIFENTGCVTCTNSEAKVNYYTEAGNGTAQGQIELVGTYAARTIGQNVDAGAGDHVSIVIGAGCSDTAPGETDNASQRSYAAVYGIELDSSSTPYGGVCQEG